MTTTYRHSAAFNDLAAIFDYADFAQHFGVGKNKHIILVLDRAGWHTSDQVEVPEGIHLFFLPAYSPELQPAERL